jgi:hypothetical protein
MPDLLLDDLRQAVTRKGVVVVVGAGVSVWSTNRARAASWTGLLETGIDWCHQLGRAPSKDWAARRRRDLRSGDLRDLLAVAEQVADRLGAQAASRETVGGEYRRCGRDGAASEGVVAGSPTVYVRAGGANGVGSVSA